MTVDNQRISFFHHRSLDLARSAHELPMHLYLVATGWP